MSDVSPLGEKDFPKPHQESMLEAVAQMTDGIQVEASLTRETSNHTVPPGAMSVNVKNTGPGTISVAGGNLPSGEEINLPPCPGIRYDAIVCVVPSGEEALILTLTEVVA